MARAILALASVGSPMASSKALVCRLWVPPSTAARASMVVRTTLFRGSWAVRLTPLVWQWVRSFSDAGSLAPKPAMIPCHRVRAARSLATSMNRFMPMAKKKLRRGANSSTSRPRDWAARTYSMPSARVKASSRSAGAPASCRW